MFFVGFVRMFSVSSDRIFVAVSWWMKWYNENNYIYIKIYMIININLNTVKDYIKKNITAEKD